MARQYTSQQSMHKLLIWTYFLYHNSTMTYFSLWILVLFHCCHASKKLYIFSFFLQNCAHWVWNCFVWSSESFLSRYFCWRQVKLEAAIKSL